MAGKKRLSLTLPEEFTRALDKKARRIASELLRGLRVPREDREYVLEQLIENGLTEEEMKEVSRLFVDSVNEQLGLEDEIRFTEYKAAEG